MANETNLMGRLVDGKLTNIKRYSPAEQREFGTELVGVSEHPASPAQYHAYDAANKRATAHPQLVSAEQRRELIDLEQRRAAAERLGLTEEQSELAAKIAALRGD